MNTPPSADVASIRPASPRTSVQARLPDRRIFEAPPGTLLRDILWAATPADALPALAAIVDARLSELTTPLWDDADVVPVTAADAIGMRVYRRSLVCLLVTAAAEVFPEAAVIIDHAATTRIWKFCNKSETIGKVAFEEYLKLDSWRAVGRVMNEDYKIVSQKSGKGYSDAYYTTLAWNYVIRHLNASYEIVQKYHPEIDPDYWEKTVVTRALALLPTRIHYDEWLKLHGLYEKYKDYKRRKDYSVATELCDEMFGESSTLGN